jgi:hypothetical protein
VKAYLKQQRGYGEAEGLLKRKHPEKFQGFRADLSWAGRIYTRAGLGLELSKPIIHHGLFGTGMFQTVYSPPPVWWPLMVLSFEWWALALALLGLAPVFNPAAALARAGILGNALSTPLLNPLFLLPVAMLALTAGVAHLVAGQASPPVHQRRWWSRLLIAAMHVAQPVERGWARYRTRFETIVIPTAFHALRRAWQRRAGGVLQRRRVELWSERGVGREKLLESILKLAAENRWFVRVDPGWSARDVRFYGDRWCKSDLLTATENHGGGRMLTRVRLEPAATLFQKALWMALGYLLFLAWGLSPTFAVAMVPVLVALLVHLRASGRRLNAVVMAAVLSIAEQVGMTVLGAPEVFARPLEAMGEGSLPLPCAGSALRLTALSVSPILARAAGLDPAPPVATP